MQLGSTSPSYSQVRASFVALDEHATRLASLTRQSQDATPELLLTAKQTLDLADAAASVAAPLLRDEHLGAAANQARQGIDHLLGLGDDARETLAQGFDGAALLSLRRVATGLHGVSQAMLQSIDER